MKKELTGPELIAFLQSGVEKAGSQKRYAEQLDVTESFLSEVLNYRRDPSPKLLESLGYARKMTYTPVLKRKS